MYIHSPIRVHVVARGKRNLMCVFIQYEGLVTEPGCLPEHLRIALTTATPYILTRERSKLRNDLRLSVHVLGRVVPLLN
jgi:hypothetical protein